MTNAAHLTPEQLRRYQDRTLAPGELLSADRHIADCGECRGVLFHRSGVQAQLSGLRSRFSEHLAYEQIVAMTEGRGDPKYADHLKECPQCRAEVEDLRQFRRELEPTPAGVVEMPRRRAAWVLPAWSAAAAA